MSNTFVTPKAVSTIAQSRINYNDSLTALLSSFASVGSPGSSSVSLEGSTGLQEGMLWYKSGSTTSDGQGRLFVYNGSEFTRNGINSYKVPSVSAANAAVAAGAISYGELVVVGTDTLYIVNSANTGVVPLSVGDASNAELLDGLDSTQFLRSDVADSTSGKLTVSNTLSVTQNVGIGVSSPTVPLDIAKDSAIVSINDTNGSIGGISNAYITFKSSGSRNGDIGFVDTSTGAMSMLNRQGNIVIGADVNNLHANSAIFFTVDNTTAAVVDSSGNVGIGIATASTRLDVNGTATATDFNTTSDIRLKRDVSTIENALERVCALRGVDFVWVEDSKPSIGFIAQEVEEVLPQVVGGTEERKTISYQSLIALLVEAIKEQQQRIERLESGR